MITQGGKRDGANMAVMSVRHPDILSFIDCKKEEGDIHNFNISVAVDTAFMNAVKLGHDYTLNDPKTGFPLGTLNAREVFLKIIHGAWRNGEPGMVFLDRINVDNKVGEEYGDMIATNPCGEQPLLGYESCNLGSINLSKFVLTQWQLSENWEESIDWGKLQQVVRDAVHFLDLSLIHI